jgi:hypothetical protein
MANKILKQIMFSEEINRRAMQMAKFLGLSVPEYIRYLIVKDSEEVEILDEETSKEVAEAYQEYKRGNFTVYDPKEYSPNFLMDNSSGNNRIKKIQKKSRKANKGK